MYVFTGLFHFTKKEYVRSKCIEGLGAIKRLSYGKEIYNSCDSIRFVFLKGFSYLQTLQDHLRRREENTHESLLQLQADLKACQKKEERMTQEMYSIRQALQVILEPWKSMRFTPSP